MEMKPKYVWWRVNAARIGMEITSEATMRRKKFNPCARANRFVGSARQNARRPRPPVARGRCCSRNDAKPLTTKLQQKSRGLLMVVLPPEVAQSSGFSIGQRIWFCVATEGVHITVHPWGAYPAGRRSSARVQRVRSRIRLAGELWPR